MKAIIEKIKNLPIRFWAYYSVFGVIALSAIGSYYYFTSVKPVSPVIAETVSSTGMAVSEDVYLVYSDNEVAFNESVLAGFRDIGKKFNQNVITVKKDDKNVSDIMSKFASGAYYPVFVFGKSSPNVKFSDIPKEMVVESGDKFAMKEPLVLNLPKIVIERNEALNALLSKYETNVTAKGGEKAYVLAVEDPLCPYCSAAYFDPETSKSLEGVPLKNAYFPLPIEGHENSNALIGILRANPGKETLDAVFKNQESLKKSAKATILKDVQKFVTANKVRKTLKKGSEYTEAEQEELKGLLLSLGIMGTPTYYIVTEKEIVLVGSMDMVKAYFQK